jgi:hypothetical protein
MNMIKVKPDVGSVRGSLFLHRDLQLTATQSVKSEGQVRRYNQSDFLVLLVLLSAEKAIVCQFLLDSIGFLSL